MSNKKKNAALAVAKYQESPELVILPTVERVDDGYWVTAQIWVSDNEVAHELKEQDAEHALAERKRIKEEGAS